MYIKTNIEEKNKMLLAQKVAQFNKLNGVRVGDYVRLPIVDKRQNEYTRITNVWSDKVQTGGGHSSYFIGFDDGLCYSGGLDSGLALDALVWSGETKPGSVWFFSGDEVKAHNGVTFLADMRVFNVVDGADVSGCYHALGCPYRLNAYTEKQMRDFDYQYKYRITENGCNLTSFNTESELLAWLNAQNLILLNGRIDYPGNQR